MVAMATKNKSRVQWNNKAVLVRVGRTADKICVAIAHQIEGQAKANIASNDQIDTGFMLNSVHTVTPAGGTYDQTQPSGKYNSRRTGKEVDRTRAEQISLPPNASAAVAVAADYAIHQEVQNSFLYRAAEQVASQVGATVEQVAKEELG
jgi:hypothetical protein